MIFPIFQMLLNAKDNVNLLEHSYLGILFCFYMFLMLRYFVKFLFCSVAIVGC